MQDNAKLPLTTHTFKAMGSVCELKLYIPHSKKPKQIISTLLAEVSRLEEKYTRYKETSVTTKINNNAGKQATTLDNESLQLLHYANTLYEQSGGMFDITSGILRKAWDFKSGILPSNEALSTLLPHIGWNRVSLENNSIYLPDAQMEIDFGGYVKEYAADALATLCAQLEVHQGLINLGGDIRILGPHPNGDAWRVGIQHPRELNKAITAIDIYEGAIATSGDYERFMMIDGIRYCHLLNPHTGQSIQPKFASVSIIAQQCIVAGSFTSIAMLRSASENSEESDWIHQQDIPYLAIAQDMTMLGPLANNT